MLNIPPFQMMVLCGDSRRFCHAAARPGRKLSIGGLVFRAHMLHENAALAADSPPGYAKSSIDWYSFAQ
jgi:hypothetical protein